MAELVWPEHDDPDCTGTWVAYAACHIDHPGFLRCMTCGASHRATSDLMRASLLAQLRIVRLVLEIEGEGAEGTDP